MLQAEEKVTPQEQSMWAGVVGKAMEADKGVKVSGLDIYQMESVALFPEEGEKAFAYLVSGMPDADKKNLSSELLMSNLEYAMKARTEFPWSEGISEEMFFNDVLPYAVIDETREDWRPRFYEICRTLVKDCETSGEAAQVLNRELFDIVNVHYNRKRKKPNQSPSESMEDGKGHLHGAECDSSLRMSLGRSASAFGGDPLVVG